MDALAGWPGIAVRAGSRIYETAPVGPPGQGPYLNAALELATALAPRALLEVLLRIEALAGRRREGMQRWGPRILDLDLLLVGSCVLEQDGLVLPHPRLHERAFVLEPLAALAPALVHPRLGRSIAALAQACRDPEAVRQTDAAPLWPPPRCGVGGEGPGAGRAPGGT